jgi:hypothetical protein
MGYNYKITNYYKVKKEGIYPRPIPANPDETLQLFTDDILTKNRNGTYTCHTGVCMLGIKLKEDEVELIKETAHLVIM